MDPFDTSAFDRAFAPFYDTPVAFHGERADARPLDLTVMCMVTEDSPVPMPGEAVAPTRERTFDVAFPRDSWCDATPPHVGEWVCFKWAGEEIRAKVAQVSRLPDGDFTLSAIWNPKESGGPTWLA